MFYETHSKPVPSKEREICLKKFISTPSIKIFVHFFIDRFVFNIFVGVSDVFACGNERYFTASVQYVFIITGITVLPYHKSTFLRRGIQMKLNEILRNDKRKKVIFGTPRDSRSPHKSTLGQDRRPLYTCFFFFGVHLLIFDF